MFIKEDINNHFLSLFNDENYAEMYFSDINIISYNNGTLKELIRNIETANIRYQKLLPLLKTVASFNNVELLPKLNNAVINARLLVIRAYNELANFESSLSYLIISGNIDINNISGLGFDNKYIDELLIKYKELLSHPYKEYYYDENTGKTSQILKNGQQINLSYTPFIVQKEIGNQKFFGC